MSKLNKKSIIHIKKIISILTIFFLLITTFTTIVYAKGIFTEMAPKIKDSNNKLEQQKNEISTRNIIADLREKTQMVTEKIKNIDINTKGILEKIREVKLFSSFKNLMRLRAASSRLSLYTNYAGNVKTSPIRLGMPTMVDIDNDGDKDIRASFSIYPSIEEPLVFLFNIRLKIDRLSGFEDINEFFQVYVELTFPGWLYVNQMGDKVQFGYQSDRGDEVPDTCYVTYKYLPYIFYKEKPKHKVSLNPGTASGKDDLALVFSYNDYDNTTDSYSTRNRWITTFSPAIKTEITFGGADEYFGRQFRFDSSKPSLTTIHYTKYSNGSEFNGGLVIDKISSFSFEMEITPFKKGGGRIEYIRNTSDPVDVTLFFEKTKNMYIYVDDIPQHARLSWTPEKDGLIELNTFDERIKEVGIRDTPLNEESYNAKGYIRNLPALTFLNWNWNLQNGEVDLFCNQSGMSAFVDIKDLLGTGTSVLGEFYTNENLNMSFYWDRYKKTFGIKRTNTDISFSLDINGSNGSSFHFSAGIKNTINGPFEIKLGKLLNGKADIQFTSNYLEIYALDTRLNIPSVGKFILQMARFSFEKDQSGIRFNFSVINNSDNFEFSCTIEVFNGVTIEGLVVGFNDFIVPIPDIHAGGYWKNTFSFGFTKGFIDYYISPDRSSGWVCISGGLNAAFSSSLENPIGTVLGSIKGAASFKTKSDSLNVSWKTVDGKTQIDVDGSGVLALSGFEFVVKDKFNIKIPSIVGEFTINTYKREGNVKLKLGESSASFRTDFNISIPGLMNIDLKSSVALDFNAGLSGFVGFAWGNGNIRFISGGGSASYNGSVELLGFTFRYNSENPISIGFDKFGLYGSLNLGVDAYVSFIYGSHNISYVTSGGNSAFDGSVQIHGLSFDGIIGKETSISVGKIVLSGGFDAGFEFKLQNKDIDLGLDLDSTTGTHFNIENLRVLYGSATFPAKPPFEGIYLSVGGIDLDVYMAASISLKLLNTTKPSNISFAVDTEKTTDITITSFAASGMGINEISFSRLYARGRGSIYGDTDLKQVVFAADAALSLSGIRFKQKDQSSAIIVTCSGFSIGANGVIKLDWNADFRILFDLVGTFSFSHLNIQGPLDLFSTFSVKASGRGALILGPTLTTPEYVKLVIDARYKDPLEINNLQLLVKTSGISVNVNWNRLYMLFRSNATVSFNLQQQLLKLYANIETIEFKGFTVKYKPSKNQTITFKLGGKLSFPVFGLLTIKAEVSTSLDPLNLNIKLHKGTLDISKFYLYFDTGTGVSFEGKWGSLKIRGLLEFNVRGSKDQINIGLNGYGSITLDDANMLLTLNGEKAVELGYFMFDLDDYKGSVLNLIIEPNNKKFKIQSASLVASIAKIVIRDLKVNISPTDTEILFLEIKNLNIDFTGGGQFEANLDESESNSDIQHLNIDGSLTGDSNINVDKLTFWLYPILFVNITEFEISGPTTFYLDVEGKLNFDAEDVLNMLEFLSLNVGCSNHWSITELYIYGMIGFDNLEGYGDLSIGTEITGFDEEDGIPEGDFIVTPNGAWTWNDIKLFLLWTLDGNFFTGPSIGSGSFDGNLEIRIDLATFIGLFGYGLPETGRFRFTANSFTEIDYLTLSDTLKVASFELTPGRIEIKYDIPYSGEYVQFDIETTSHITADIPEFNFEYNSKNYELSLLKIDINSGSSSLYFELLDAPSKGKILIKSTGTYRPKFGAINLKNKKTGRSISLTAIEFSGFKKFELQWDLDVIGGNPDNSGGIILKSDPIYYNIVVFDLIKIGGYIWAVNFSISWGGWQPDVGWNGWGYNGSLTTDSTIDVFIENTWRRLWPFGSPPPQNQLNVEVIYDGDKLFENDPFRVHVTDAQTSAPISGATVCYRTYNDKGQIIYETSKTTDNTGNAIFTAVEVPFDDKDGQISCEANATAAGYKSNNAYFIVWDKTALIQGYVKDVNGNGIGGALVTTNVGGYSTYTRDKPAKPVGLYQLKVDPGTYKMIATKEGYEPGESIYFIIEPGDSFQVPDIVLQSNFGYIEGTVYEKGTNKPLYLAKISLDGNKAIDVDSNGHYLVEAYPGSHTLKATCVNHYPETKYNIQVNQGQATQVDFYLEQSGQWIHPTGHDDPSEHWSNEQYAYDLSTSTYAKSKKYYTAQYTGYLELVLSQTIECTKIKFIAYEDINVIDKAKVDVYYNGGWHNIWDGPYPSMYPYELFIDPINKNTYQVSKARISFHVRTGIGNFAELYDFQFYKLE